MSDDPLEAVRKIVADAEWDADTTARAEKIMADAFAQFGEFAGPLRDGERSLIRQCSESEAQLRRMIYVILAPCLETAGVPDPYHSVDTIVNCILAIRYVQRVRNKVFSKAGASKGLAKTANKAKKKAKSK
jgi:hypothetical protein